MKTIVKTSAVFALTVGIAACGSTNTPRFDNGQYTPPPAKNALRVELLKQSCDGGSPALPAVLAPLIIAAGSALASQSYDRFINWLEEKKANLSVSSTGVTSTSFLANSEPKRCLKLTRADSLQASFSISRVGSSGYWHMAPYSMKFARSEAKENPTGEKNIIAEIEFATPDASGKPVSFFLTTFDLGAHKSGEAEYSAISFVGQDSGPYGTPKPSNATDADLTLKITASLIEHGEGRDWVRGVAVSLREQETKDKALKPIKDALGKLGQ